MIYRWHSGFNAALFIDILKTPGIRIAATHARPSSDEGRRRRAEKGLKYHDGDRVVSKCVVVYTFVGSLLQKKKREPLGTLSSSGGHFLRLLFRERSLLECASRRNSRHPSPPSFLLLRRGGEQEASLLAPFNVICIFQNARREGLREKVQIATARGSARAVKPHKIAFA